MNETNPTGTPGGPVLLLCEDGHPALETLRRAAATRRIPLVERDAGAPIDPEGLPLDWVLAVRDEALPALLEQAIAAHATVAFLPTRGSMLPRLFDLPRGTDAQVTCALDAEPVAIDVTRCNGELVLTAVAIGDVPFLDQRGRAFLRMQPTRWRRAWMALGVFWSAARRLLAIRPSSVKLHIGEEEKPRRSAVTGIVVMENDIDKISAALMGERLSARDARLSAMLFAPASVSAYLAVLLRAVFGGTSLPRALSFVRSRRLSIESEQPLAYRIDGRRRQANRIEFSVSAKDLRVRPGPAFVDNHPVGTESRDSLRLRTLPENELRLASLREGLPLFTHALEEDFRELFLLLRDNARVTPDYVVLMVTATLLAGLGLILNSPAVIIGAMVLAPLMSPIVSLAMGVLRRDSTLLKGAIRAIAYGVALALGAAATLSLLLPLQPLTGEIEGRLHASLLDLGVAVVSGIAAAYAYARESVMKSLPGVAIAVALVPPLAVAGIGIGWGDLRVFGGAMLMFLTNLVGISAAAALTFLVLGFAPIRTAAQGLRIMAAVTALLALPLYLSLDRMVDVWRLENQVRDLVLESGTRSLRLNEPQVRLDGDRAVVRAVLSSSRFPDDAEIEQIKAALESRLERPVNLELDLRIAR